jgi:chaperonin GroEL (HSP60 family)
MEIIPRSLSENAGLEPIDILVALRSAHDKPDGIYQGVNVFTGEIQNSIENGSIEPAVVKEQALKSAAESAAMILRIDDVISSSKPKGGPGGPAACLAAKNNLPTFFSYFVNANFIKPST